MKWIEDESGFYADSGDRTYIVRPFSPAAHDGDPSLTMVDPDRYISEAWGLRVWIGNDTKGPIRLFSDAGFAKIAAEEIEQGYSAA